MKGKRATRTKSRRRTKACAEDDIARRVMNQAEIRKLIPALRVAIQPRQRKFRNPDGPEGRLNKMRATVTELVKNERIELNYNRADEARGYTERVRHFLFIFHLYQFYFTWFPIFSVSVKKKSHLF